MALFDKLFRSRSKESQPAPSPQRRYPARSIVSDPDLRTLADFRRHYPLPAGYEYQERKPNDIVVVRSSDGAEFVFLVEEGILAWDVPHQKRDGSWGKKTTEVLKQREAGPHAALPPAQPDFPLGENIISDPDIRTFADLGRYYPLPAGFEYQRTADGAPSIARLNDGRQFRFLIEEEMLTFDEPYTRQDGRIGHRTTEVLKGV